MTIKLDLSLKTCLIVIAGILLALFVFKIPLSGLLTFGLILLCPLMHLFMMKGMGYGKENCHSGKKVEVEEGKIVKE